jgi:cytolysin (calcineurin-like family phosphatase)
VKESFHVLMRIVLLFLLSAIISCGSENPPFKTIENFTSTDHFYVAVVGDPQLYWKCSAPDCIDNALEDSAEYHGSLSNKWQVQSLNSLITTLGNQFYGVIINGDLTAFGHKDEYDAYLYFYESILKGVVFPGLGNHDYENNINDCFENNCALRMIRYMKDKINSLPVSRHDMTVSGTTYVFPQNVKTWSGSFAYSWDVGNIHFIQLNNYPHYETSFEGWNFEKARRDYVTVTSALTWLQNDLAAADAAGKKIIINVHKGAETVGNSSFLSTISGYDVIAIFGAHIHSQAGFLYNTGGGIPVYGSGSPAYGTYLVVEIQTDAIAEVRVVDSSYGQVVYQ